MPYGLADFAPPTLLDTVLLVLGLLQQQTDDPENVHYLIQQCSASCLPCEPWLVQMKDL